MKTVKCISNRLNHVVFGDDGTGRKPRRVKPGETFKVRNVPKNWDGLVSVVDDGTEKKAAMTNPEGSQPKPAPAKK